MHGIYELKEMLCDELEEYGKKGDLSTGSLDVVDKLAHTIKNLDKIIDCYEEDGGSYAYYDDGMRSRRSYARGRRGYSRDGDIAGKLRELMHEVPDEHMKQEIKRLADKMDR